MAAMTPRRRKTDAPVRRSAPLLAYLLIVAVVGVVIFASDRSADRDEYLRQRVCEQAAENRAAIRQVYRDVANLGRTLGTTPESQEMLRKRLDEFEKERLSRLPSLSPEGCDGS